MSLSNLADIRSSKGTASIDIFLSFEGHAFLFPCMPCDFFVEHWTFESNNEVTLAIRFSSFLRFWLLLFLFLKKKKKTHCRLSLC